MLISSTSRTFGCWIRARAMASICCSPPESAPAGRRQRLSSAGKTSRSSRGAGPRRDRATSRFSSTVSVVNSDRLSGTSTTPARLAATAFPLRSATPSTLARPAWRREQPGQREQQRRLAGAVRAEQREHGPGVHVEVEVAEHDGGAAAPRQRPRHSSRTLVASGSSGATTAASTFVHAVTASVSCIVPRYASATARSARIASGGPSAITAPKSST